MRVSLGVAVLLSVFAAPVVGQSLPDPIWPIRDDYGVLAAETASAVRGQIEELRAQTGAEIGVLIIASTQGRDAHEYGLEVFNHWGIGQADQNNGVLLLFAMDDRRVELVPGVAYETLFTRPKSEALLKGVAVPFLRAGQPERAVAAMVEEVAREIRIREGVEIRAPEGVGESATPEAVPQRVPSTPPTAEELALRQQAEARRGRSQALIGAAGVVLLLGWTLAVAALLFVALRRGRLLVPGWALWAAIAGGFVFVGVASLLFSQWARGGAGAVGGIGFLAQIGLVGVACHICPRCSRWCSIQRRTLRPASYSSSGTGERTTHCRHCGYHDVKVYTIAKKTHSSSGSSGGSSFGGGGSFGGGSSRGGGGGASW